MNIAELQPPPTFSESFQKNRERFIPEYSGCYVLTTFSKVILYIGLASNLRKRINQHLDNPKKTEETIYGRAVLFYWIETQETNKLERTWLNEHILAEGVLPILNKFNSPVFT